jgi:hypothetical protein
MNGRIDARDYLPRRSNGIARMFEKFRKNPIRPAREYSLSKYIISDLNCSAVVFLAFGEKLIYIPQSEYPS